MPRRTMFVPPAIVEIARQADRAAAAASTSVDELQDVATEAIRTSVGDRQKLWEAVSELQGKLVALGLPTVLQGEPGLSAEMRVSDGAVQWRQTGGEWRTLVPLAAITGPKGDAGLSAELRVSGGAVEWRQTGGHWQTLVPLAAITGPAGSAGTWTARLVSVPIAAPIHVGSQLDVAVVWTQPMPSPVYRVEVAPGSGLAGRVTWSVKAGSQTPAGCVVTVKASQIVAVGAILNVLAVG